MRVLLVPAQQQQGGVTVQEVTLPDSVLQQYAGFDQYEYGDAEQLAPL